MRKVLTLMTLAVCLTATASATTIYGAGDNANLYTIDPTTGNTTLIGAMGVTMFDIAEYAGKLYGISGVSTLYSINTSTGAATSIGAVGQVLNALTFNSAGVLYAAGVAETDLYTINVATGAATVVAGETNATAYNSAGDLQFVGSTLYLTTQVGAGNSVLDTVNLVTGALTPIGTDLGHPKVFGLALAGGVLYGFTDAGAGSQSQVVTVNTGTGGSSGPLSYGGTTFGFNGTTDNNSVPEPGTLGLIGLGLVGFGSIAYQRRRHGIIIHTSEYLVNDPSWHRRIQRL